MALAYLALMPSSIFSVRMIHFPHCKEKTPLITSSGPCPAALLHRPSLRLHLKSTSANYL